MALVGRGWLSLRDRSIHLMFTIGIGRSSFGQRRGLLRPKRLLVFFQ